MMTTLSDQHIEQLRAQIDGLDEQIVKLIGQRFEIVRKIGELKQAADKEVLDPERESKLYIRMHQMSKDYNVPLEIVIHIYDYLMNESRKIQQ